MTRHRAQLTALLLSFSCAAAANAQTDHPAPTQPPSSDQAAAGGGVPAERTPSRWLTDSEQPPQRGKGLMIAGLVTFGGSYLPAAFYGLVFLSMGQDGGGEPCFDCNRVGRHLLIPVFGPWLEIPDAGAKGKVEWGALGLVQATGIVLSVVGIVFFVRSGKPQSAEAPLSRYALGVVPLPGGGTIGSFRMAF